MAPLLGPGAVEVEGIVSSATDAEWKLHLLRVDHRLAGTVPWNREEVTFPRPMLIQVREKRLSKKRSILAAAGLTGGALLLARIFGVVGVGDDGDPGGDGTPAH